MTDRWSLLLASLSLAGAIAVCAHGCGGNDLVVGGMIPLTATPVETETPVVNCGGVGTPCNVSRDCCSAICDPNTLTCD